MELRSPAFEDGQPIPLEHTCDGRNISPALKWSDPPPGVQEYAILMEDLDSPQKQRFFNWVLYGIPAPILMFPEAIPREDRDKLLAARQGTNSFSYDNKGYRGPSPLEGRGEHRYKFTLFALGKKVRVRFGASGEELLQTIGEHVLEEATLTCTYRRH